MNLRGLLDQVQYREKEEPNDLKRILCELVQRESAAIYLNGENLQEQLRKEGISVIVINQICMITNVSGFQELIHGDESEAMQSEVDRFVRNAIRETGLVKTTIMKLTEDIAASLQITMIGKSIEEIQKVHESKEAYIIPYSLYELDLKILHRQIFYGSGTCDLERLQTLVAAGIPEAKFYMGYYTLNSLETEKINEKTDSEAVLKAVRLLKEAAEEGCIEAAGVLGDYYYEQNTPDSLERAYHYFTEYGALALNKQRRQRITDILNHKIYNKKILGLSIGLVLLTVVSVIGMFKISLYKVHPVWSILCLLVEAALTYDMITTYKKCPYRSFCMYPAGISFVWGLWLLLKIIF